MTATKDGALIDAFVQPRARRQAVAGLHGTALKLKVKSPPVEGRANREAEELVATVLDLPRAAVSVVGGHTSRHKRIAVVGLPAQLVSNRLSVVLSSSAHESR